LIIDDPHSEQDALSDTAMEHAYEWYTSGPRQRLQPGGAIVIVMTRWSLRDLTEKVLKAQGYDEHADKWEVIEFPALMPSGKPCWPEYWDQGELEGVRASLSASKWNAQWQQNPVSQEGAIIKKDWWQRWDNAEVPQLEYVIQSYDTAFSRKETADYSAITTWGVFYPKQDGPANLILLDSKKGRWDFPELKNQALEQYNFWEPETVIIEAKASGTPLTQELRQLGIPVVNFTPSKGNDKLTRVHAVSTLFESGMIWAPDERWADEVIEECAAFPNGDHDDLVDSTTQALLRYRQGNFVQLPSDDWVDEEPSMHIRSYYG
jgi:predicted phage terminase large subunit-like protein